MILEITEKEWTIMKIFKMTYTDKSVNSILAWACLAVPLVYALYVLFSAGNYLNENELAQIIASVIFSISAIFIFTGLTSKNLRKREELLESIYTEWAPKVGVKTLPENAAKYSQSVKRTVRVEWITATDKVSRLSLEGNSPMSLDDIQKFLEFINQSAPKKKQYTLDLSELGSGIVTAIMIEPNDNKKNMLETQLGLLKVLQPLFPNDKPQVDLSEDFNKEHATLDSFMVKGLRTVVLPRDYKKLESTIEQYHPAQEHYRWELEPISDSIVSFQQVNTKDARNNEHLLKLLDKIGAAALQFAASYALVENAEVFEVDNGAPADFNIILKNDNDLSNEETFKKFTTGLTRIVESKFSGQWQVIDLRKDHRVGLTMIG